MAVLDPAAGRRIGPDPLRRRARRPQLTLVVDAPRGRSPCRSTRRSPRSSRRRPRRSRHVRRPAGPAALPGEPRAGHRSPLRGGPPLGAGRGRHHRGIGRRLPDRHGESHPGVGSLALGGGGAGAGSARCRQHAADRRAARRPRLRGHRAALPRRAGPRPDVARGAPRAPRRRHARRGARGRRSAVVASRSSLPRPDRRGRWPHWPRSRSCPCRAVVAIAPSSVVWQAPASGGGRPPDASSWTLRGAPLPWTPLRRDKLFGPAVPHAVVDRLRRRLGRAVPLRPAYAASLGRHAADAEIAAERIDAPLLLLAGEDDQVWPSVDMATRLLDRRARAEDRLLAFPDAGHLLAATPHSDDGVRGRRGGLGWHPCGQRPGPGRGLARHPGLPRPPRRLAGRRVERAEQADGASASSPDGDGVRGRSPRGNSEASGASRAGRRRERQLARR